MLLSFVHSTFSHTQPAIKIQAVSVPVPDIEYLYEETDIAISMILLELFVLDQRDRSFW